LGLGAGFGTADWRNMLAQVFGAAGVGTLALGAVEGVDVAGAAMGVEAAAAGAGVSVESPQPVVVVVVVVVVVSSADLWVSHAGDSSVGTESG